jgi:hypothetical protein
MGHVVQLGVCSSVTLIRDYEEILVNLVDIATTCEPSATHLIFLVFPDLFHRIAPARPGDKCSCNSMYTPVYIHRVSKRVGNFA